MSKTSKRRRVRVGDPDFVAPDGGWGWWILVACGLANLSVFPTMQQFGLLFKDRFEQLGMTSAETTTIINLNSAFASGIGLLNGPIFRYLSYRQVTLIGSFVVPVSLTIASYCNSFWSYVVLQSFCYGCGVGVLQSGTSIALNTYFKKRRRIATGLSWSMTACGSCAWPYIITFLLPVYGPQGTAQIFAAISANTIVCSLLLQPVHWHTKFQDAKVLDTQKEKSVCFLENKATNDISGSLKVSNNALTVPFKSDSNLYENEKSYSQKNSKNIILSVEQHNNVLDENLTKKERLVNIEPTPEDKTDLALPKHEEKPAQISLPIKEVQLQHNNTENTPEIFIESDDKGITQRILSIFDFDLLNDITFLNLLIGMNMANFADFNFTILTPFVLSEYEFTDNQIATFISIVAGADAVMRLVFPFIAEKIGWENKTYFLFGVMYMALGRIALLETQDSSTSTFVAILIGFGRGLKTVFSLLVISSYVSLDRLPGAFGLHLATGGLLSVLFGPLVGRIRDLTNNYTITLHILNLTTCLPAFSWGAESLIRRMMQPKNETTKL